MFPPNCFTSKKTLTEPGRYNKCVKIGNWFEERALEDDTIKEYLYKKENGLLSSQKKEASRGEFLKLLDLSYCPKGHVKYGDKVMFLNVLNTNLSTETRCLSLHVPYAQRKLANFSFEYIETSVGSVAATDLLSSPTPFTTFQIMGPTAAHDNQVLKYGDPFYIYTFSGKLLLSSVKQPPYKPRVNVSGHNGVFMQDKCHKSCLFKALPLHNPMESEGEPVMANTKLRITHLQTNENLSIEDEYLQGYFGPEKVVACKRLLDSHKQPSQKNIWCIYMDAPGKGKFNIVTS